MSDQGAAGALANKPGRDWHLYGDIRWPWPATWVEFPFPTAFNPARGGVLIVRRRIPVQEANPLSWAAKNHPLAPIQPDLREGSTLARLWGSLGPSAAIGVPLPQDTQPDCIQGYMIFIKIHTEIRPLACYTDILNASGVPIAIYRLGSTDHEGATKLCQFALHGLFLHADAWRRGAAFVVHHQLPKLEPVALAGDAAPPQWAQFHPVRSLRLRPALRALSTPELDRGMMKIEDHHAVTEVRRLELNLHQLAFERPARIADTATLGKDTNTSLTAFMHRGHGGANYVLPERLVEEFYNTDCAEVCLSDLRSPFASIFLRFRPPEALKLGEGVVDGCYVCRQGDEFLFVLTSRLEGVDYANSLSVTCLDPTFSLHVPTTDPTMPLNKAVEAGIEDFLARNAPPDEDQSMVIEHPDGQTSTVVDVRARSRLRRIQEFRSQEAAFRAALNIVVNALCFIEFRPEDITEGWAGQPPAELLAKVELPPISRHATEKAAGARKRLEQGDYTRIRICGRNLFADSSEDRSADAAGIGQGTSPRTHWRRGHWRRQRHGTGLALVGMRWIRPTIVRKDAGEPVETRVYLVGEAV